MAGPEIVYAAMETTEDAFLGGRLMVAQPKAGSRAGLDTVFLAASCSAAGGDHVLDAGSGSGIVGLLAACRIEGLRVTGVEIDAGLCALAKANAARNGFGGQSEFIHGDLAGPAGALFAAGLAADSIDHALANPPFLTAGEARLPPEPRLRRAHGAEPGDLERWVKTMAALVKPGGTMTMIHRADALGPILRYCEGRFGALSVYPLFPRHGEPASRVVVQAEGQ
ncbi:MAG: methyltransferase domain-containing protein, partial [Rhodomicrobium sp.]|nr:methyltransferase domain-containing protein [Rhodomicrobium sp.]